MKTTQRPQHGDVAWFVQWWPTTIIDENGDFDHDATEAASKQKRCLSRIDAMAFAKQVWSPDNAFGVVEMHQSRYITRYDDGDPAEPHWECITEPEHYDGESWD